MTRRIAQVALEREAAAERSRLVETWRIDRLEHRLREARQNINELS